LLQARCEVLRRIGLKATYTANEPHVLPEAFFADHPDLRGPRVDHANRSRTPRFAPCADQPATLALYRRPCTSGRFTHRPRIPPMVSTGPKFNVPR